MAVATMVGEGMPAAASWKAKPDTFTTRLAADGMKHAAIMSRPTSSAPSIVIAPSFDPEP
jgi:hypothetical protein